MSSGRTGRTASRLQKNDRYDHDCSRRVVRAVTLTLGMHASVQRPLLLVVSAPSGAGKTTLCARLLEAFPDMVRSVSCTTRPPRPGETDGRDYFFVDDAEFQRRVDAGAFLEYARVHGACYGTPREPIERALRTGRDVLLIIDVQGAEHVRQFVAQSGGNLRRAFVDVFIMPPDSAALRQRLVARGQDDEATIERRLKNARGEMDAAALYRYRIVNDRLEDAAERLRKIVREEKQTLNPSADGLNFQRPMKEAG